MTHVIVLAALHGVLRDVAGQVGRHGYLIVFVLIAAESFAFPLPGEVSLLVGAYEAERGVFSLPWVIVVGAAAAITGDNLAYLVGRTAGRPVVERVLRFLRMPATYLERMDSYYLRHAGWTVAVARQVSPVRGLAALSAGGSRVVWRRFFAFNAMACVVWATVVTLLATLFVRHLDALADDISLAGLIVVAAAVLAGAVFLWRRVRRRVGRGAAASRADDDRGGGRPTGARRRTGGIGPTGPRRRSGGIGSTRPERRTAGSARTTPGRRPARDRLG